MIHELHLPGYEYCGPGTNFKKKRLTLGQPGINGLDSACREHDISYKKVIIFPYAVGQPEYWKNVLGAEWGRKTPIIKKKQSRGL